MASSMKVYERGCRFAVAARAAAKRDPETDPVALAYARGYFDALDDAMRSIGDVNTDASRPSALPGVDSLDTKRAADELRVRLASDADADADAVKVAEGMAANPHMFPHLLR